jgi:hypothetical protein
MLTSPGPDVIALAVAGSGRAAAAAFSVTHQQPPKTPLLRSTNAANAGHVESSRALTVYVGSIT